MGSWLRGIEAWMDNHFLQLMASMAARVGPELLTRPLAIAVFVVASSAANSVERRAEEFRAYGVRSTSGFLSSSLPLLAFRSLSRLRGIEAWMGNPFLQLIARMAARVGPELLTRPPRHCSFRGSQLGRKLSGES